MAADIVPAVEGANPVNGDPRHTPILGESGPTTGEPPSSSDLIKALEEVAAIFRTYTNPGDSDLDDEQPYPIHLPLGLLRKIDRLTRS